MCNTREAVMDLEIQEITLYDIERMHLYHGAEKSKTTKIFNLNTV